MREMEQEAFLSDLQARYPALGDTSWDQGADRHSWPKPKYAHTQRPVLLALGEPETFINTVPLSSVAIPTFHRLDMKIQFMSLMKRSTEFLLFSLGLSSQYREGRG